MSSDTQLAEAASTTEVDTATPDTNPTVSDETDTKAKDPPSADSNPTASSETQPEAVPEEAPEVS